MDKSGVGLFLVSSKVISFTSFSSTTTQRKIGIRKNCLNFSFSIDLLKSKYLGNIDMNMTRHDIGQSDTTMLNKLGHNMVGIPQLIN